MPIDWREKQATYLEAVVDLILESALLAVWVFVTFLLGELFKLFLSEDLKHLSDEIAQVAVVLVTIVGSLELISTITLRTYHRLNKLNSTK